MDGAVVNLPLAKRGDLAKMAERSVREEAATDRRQHKARLASHRERFAEAKRLITLVSDARMAEMGRAHGLTAKQTRAQFVSAARSNPDRLITTMRREVGERLARRSRCGRLICRTGGGSVLVRCQTAGRSCS